MGKFFLIINIFASVICSFFVYSEEDFKVIVLGCGGGAKESNISGYLLAPKESNEFVALDAGSLLSGIYLANQNQCFQEIKENPESVFEKELEIFRHHVKAYLISHAHLDHVAGLVINSTEDIPKPIFGIDSVIDFFRDHLFNGNIWPNFGSEGASFKINQYQYQRLQLEKKIAISDTNMFVEPFLLSHPGNYESTAFLIESSGSYVVYFGDTAPDVLEKKKHMDKVWQRVVPLVLEKKLKGVFLECSYLDKSKNQLFGHLDAKHMIEELEHFANLVDPIYPKKALQGLKVVVVHMKDSFLKNKSAKDEIAKELEKLNDFGIVFVFPSQGEKFYL